MVHINSTIQTVWVIPYKSYPDQYFSGRPDLGLCSIVHLQNRIRTNAMLGLHPKWIVCSLRIEIPCLKLLPLKLMLHFEKVSELFLDYHWCSVTEQETIIGEKLKPILRSSAAETFILYWSKVEIPCEVYFKDHLYHSHDIFFKSVFKIILKILVKNSLLRKSLEAITKAL